MDRFEAFRVFVAVAEQGGFARGGRRLGLSPPAVTRTVAALEAHLGTSLFRRSTRSVRLTEAGSALLDRAREVLQRVQDVEQAVAGGFAVPRGILHVTAPTMFGQLHVLPVAVELMRQHPELRVRLLLMDRNVRLVEEGVDVAVRIGVLDDSSLRAATIGAARQCLVASPNYCARRGVPEWPEDLADHELIGGDSARVGPRWVFAAGRGIAVSPRFGVNSVQGRLAAAIAGLGIANVLDYQAAEAVAKGALRRVLDDFAPPAMPVSLVFAADRAQLAAVRAFLDAMKRRASTPLCGAA